MKKHMTQMELTKTRRLIESGVTDIPEIQKVVFCDEDCIRNVLDGYDIEIPEPPPPPAKKVASKKAAKGAAARAEKLDAIS